MKLALAAALLLVLPVSAQQITHKLLHSITAPAQTNTWSGYGGYSVAVAGNYIVVGSPFDDTDGPDAGIVRVYGVGNGRLYYVLRNPTPAANDQFGVSVSIAAAVSSSHRVVVGANGDDTGATDAGSAYVFNISQTLPAEPYNVTPAAAHTLNNPTPFLNDRFGASVAISGTKAVIGADGDDTNATSAGSAYVYELATTNLTPTVPVATLNNPNAVAEDHFGYAVAISGTRVVVGAPDYDHDSTFTNAGRAYVYDVITITNPMVPVVSINNPTPAISDHFGYAAAISGTRVAVAAPDDDSLALDAGSAYVYDLSGSGASTIAGPPGTVNYPSPAAGDHFGTSLAMSASKLVIGAPDDDVLDDSNTVIDVGSAYVYTLTSSGTPSIPTATLSVTLNQVAERAFDFGRSVAILSTGFRVVVGAPVALTDGTYEGKAYFYDVLNLTATTPPTAPLLSRFQATSPDNFGTSVAISGTRMVVGVPFAYDEMSNSPVGRAYVYETSGPTPTLVATLNNPTPAAYDYFGWSVAISGSRVVVGAQGDNSSGSAYVYDLSSATPTVPVFTLPNPAPAGGDLFGASVAISGTRIVVGAWSDDTGATNAGSAYVYEVASSNPTPTTPITTLNNPSPSLDDAFGFSVAISGTMVVVGASDDGNDVPQTTTPPDSGQRDQGSAYVYDFGGGFPASATPTFTLPNPSPENQDFFGSSVAVSGTRVVVGAPYDNTGASYAGSAYVYDFSGATPPTVPTPTVLNEAAQNAFYFGSSVAIDATRVVVGAPQAYYTQENILAGRSYVYNVTSGTPATSVATLNDPSPVDGDFFGSSAAISGTTIAVGAPYDDTTVLGTPDGDVTAYDKGAAYVFAPIFPEIVVEQPAGASLTNGAANLTYGIVNLGTNSAKTFTVTNTGPDALSIYSVSVTGGNTGDFPVTTTGMLTSVPAGGTTTFSVAFAPTTPGNLTTTLRIVTNDSDEGTFDIILAGTGFDGTPPDTSITSGPSGLTTSRLATVEFNGSDNVAVTSFEGRLDGAAYAMVTSPVSLSGLADGVHTFSVCAKDATGNVDPTPASVTWTVDGTVPVLTLPANIVAEATGPTGRVVTYSASASDPGSGVATSSFLPASGSTFPIGATTVNASATDNAGNTATGSFTVTVQDTTAPVGGTMTMSPASPVDPSATLTVSFASWTDAASSPLTYSVLIDNVVVSAQGSTASRIVTAPATMGAHTLKGRIHDARNNVTEVTQNFTVNSAQQSWRNLHFSSTTNSGNGADNADPDFDGIRNLVEFALGTNPTTPTSGSQVPQPVQSGANLTLSVTQPPGVSGITYGAQISTTMLSDNWTSNGVTDTDPSPTACTFSAPLGSNSLMFMRLIITNTVD
jgi:FG-GAP repeat/HYR domain/Abnormal spindle-like microcephaly-assoc'd, ASPM-SPD-2-Hydin